MVLCPGNKTQVILSDVQTEDLAKLIEGCKCWQDSSNAVINHLGPKAQDIVDRQAVMLGFNPMYSLAIAAVEICKTSEAELLDLVQAVQLCDHNSAESQKISVWLSEQP